MTRKQFHFGIGQMKRKMDQLLVFNSNTLKCLKNNFGLSLIQLIIRNWLQMVTIVCFSLIGNKVQTKCSIIHLNSYQKTLLHLRDLLSISQKLFSFQTLKWPFQVPKVVISLSGTEVLSLKVLVNKMKRDLLKLLLSIKISMSELMFCWLLMINIWLLAIRMAQFVSMTFALR